MEAKIKEMLEVAKPLLAINSLAALSGSLALYLQGFQLRREPADIDIYVPYRPPIALLPEMEMENKNEDEYPEDEYRHTFYILGQYKINFMQPNDPLGNLPITLIDSARFSGRLVVYEDIMKFKIQHLVISNNPSIKQKHKDDLLFLISNISI